MMIAITVPPAAKALAVIGAVYGLIQAAKKIPAVTPYLTGWVSVAVNVILTACGLLLTIPPGQLYTTNTALLLLTTILGAAGVHGTVASFTPPTILASVPPSTQVKSVPAVLEPINPKAIPAEPPK
jgi:hypothetical protein